MELATANLKFARRKSGALVITLAMIVLLTVVILAFLTQATGNRQVEASRAARSDTDELARSAGDYVINLFRSEIGNSSYSTIYNTSDSIYQPVTNADAVPQVLVAAANQGNANFFNLVRQSVSSADTNASTDNSSLPASNMQFIDTNCWNLPELLAGGGFSSSSQEPCWIYVSKSSGVTNAASADVQGRFAYNVYETDGLLDANAAGCPSTATNQISTLKGTLAGADLTQLGIPQSSIDLLIAFRNPTAASSATAYTNCVTLATTSGFLSLLATNSSGGITMTNNYFNSRQDLLRYVSVQNPALTDALPYLTTFSRAKNDPSWGPMTNTPNWNYIAQENAGTNNCFFPNVRAVSPSPNVPHYLDSGLPDPQLYPISAGASLVQRRFSLAKLAWITSSGPAPNISAAALQACFGLVWDNNPNNAGGITTTNYRWDYVGSTGTAVQSTIETLAQVAAETTPREPNFFELLKAGILTGSLGQNPGPNASRGVVLSGFQGACGEYFPDRYGITDRQIMQIGVNMIDQYRADNYPTAIYFPTYLNSNLTSFENTIFNTLFGVKDLPYLSQIDTVVFQLNPTPVTLPPSATGLVYGWLQPELWNPHASESSPPSVGPTQFRIRPYGICYTDLEEWGDWAGGSQIGYQPATSVDYTQTGGNPNNGIYAPTDKRCLYFSAASTDFRGNPHPIPWANLTSNNDFTTNCVQSVWNGNNSFVGFQSGQVPLSTSFPLTSGYAPYTTFSIWTHVEVDVNPQHLPQGGPSYPMTFTLDYQDSQGNWRPYNYISRLEQSLSYRHFSYIDNNGNFFPYQADGNGNYNFSTERIGSPSGDISCARVDPRTDRFSLSMGNVYSGPSYTTSPNYPTGPYWWTNSMSFQPNATTVNPTIEAWPGGSGSGATNTTFGYSYTPTGAGGSTVSLYGLALNTPGATAKYLDPDGVMRPGDAWKQNPQTVLFSVDQTPSTRPVVLNHPFTSLGDIGYVFRDLPFKSLDLSSTVGGDAALLDIFSLQNEPLVIGGTVNPNRAPALVLRALLAGGEKDQTVSTDTISQTEATSLATALTNNIATDGPLLTGADLASRLATLIDAAPTSAADQSTKSWREAPIRALVSTANTRTWNFLIDIIAQVGKMQSGATTGSGFLIQGEKHYWLHVAIDRYTDEIVDEYWEPVYE